MAGSSLDRRHFLFGATAGAGGVLADPARALSIFRRGPAEPEAEPRGLIMVNQRTRETFNEIYFDGRAHLDEALARFAHFARDLRTGSVGEMDPEVLDLAHDLQQLAGPEEPLILTHGFRSRTRRSHRGHPNSFHLVGQALDLAHPRLRASALHRHAASLGRGGLGRYRTFIHIDTGPLRRW